MNRENPVTTLLEWALAELFPKISHVAVLVRDVPESSSTGVQRVREAERAARSLGLQLQIARVGDPHDPREFDAAFKDSRGWRSSILWGRH